MEEFTLRGGRGVVYFALMYFGLKLLGIPNSKAVIVAFAPLVAGLTNLFSRELGLLSMLCLLVGLANYVTEGKVASTALDIYNQATVNAKEQGSAPVTNAEEKDTTPQKP